MIIAPNDQKWNLAGSRGVLSLSLPSKRTKDGRLRLVHYVASCLFRRERQSVGGLVHFNEIRNKQLFFDLLSLASHQAGRKASDTLYLSRYYNIFCSPLLQFQARWKTAATAANMLQRQYLCEDISKITK